MKQVTRWLAWVLCLALTMGLYASPAQAAETEFDIQGGVLVRYNGTAEKVTIPASVEAIGINAFWNNTVLTSVTLPEGLKKIDARAFENCSRLRTVNFPNSLNNISDSAFSGCASLERISLPKGLTIIEKSAFYDCKSLSEVTIPHGVTNIGYGAFSNCVRLKEVVLPDTVTKMEGFAFYNTQLTKVDIPASVTFIGGWAFAETPWQKAMGDFVYFGNTLLQYQGYQSRVEVPEGITTIGDHAFSECDFLNEVVLPESVTSINSTAFGNCTNLQNINLPEALTHLGDRAFANCRKLTVMDIPKGVTKLEEATFWYCSGLVDVTIPQGITTIDENAFFNCSGLTDVTIPNSVTHIGRSAFDSCSSLKRIIVPASVSEIGGFAFANCPKLTIHGAPGTAAEEYTQKSKGPFVGDQPGGKEPLPLVAYERTQTVHLDGKTITLSAYALKDQSGYETNYVKVRDLAAALVGTAAEFNVTWDGGINLQSRTPYVPNGTESSSPFNGDQAYTVNEAPVYLTGRWVKLDGIVLTHGSGGYTYFKLRDLGLALGFNVTWKDGLVALDTSIPYKADKVVYGEENLLKVGQYALAYAAYLDQCGEEVVSHTIHFETVRNGSGIKGVLVPIKISDQDKETPDLTVTLAESGRDGKGSFTLELPKSLFDKILEKQDSMPKLFYISSLQIEGLSGKTVGATVNGNDYIVFGCPLNYRYFENGSTFVAQVLLQGLMDA